MASDLPDEAMHFEAQGRLARLGSYHAWILRNFEGALGRCVWDAGAGVGLVTARLAERCESVLATEYGERNLAELSRRFAGDDRVEVDRCDLTGDDARRYEGRHLDTVVCLDVIEHLEDDAHALRSFHRVLVPGGRLLLKVPAHPFLYGAVDEASRHFRRYRRAGLAGAIADAGFEVEWVRHMNAAATVPYLVKSRILKRRTNFSNSLGAGRLSLYDRLIPWIERVEQRVPPPFGLSLIAVGRKPMAGA
jgi:SAM-dependent methyltransferase